METKKDLAIRVEGEKAALEEKLLKAEELIIGAGESIARGQDEVQFLQEGMRDLQMALEVRGWKLLRGGIDQKEFDGLDLDVLKDISDELRAYLSGGALAKRLIEVRANFVIGAGGVEYDGVKGKSKQALEDHANQEKIFGTKGLQEIVRAQGTDGNVILLVNAETQKVRRLPLHRVDALYVDPDDAEDILFIKERFNRITVENPQGEEVERWYRCDLNDTAEAKKRTSIKEGSREVPIDRKWVAIFEGVNGQIGHTLGTPDLLASLPWIERYNQYLNMQLEFQQALSAIAVQIKQKTTRAQQQTRSAVREGGNAAIATTGDDTEIVAQKGASDVSFENGRAIAAMASTGAEVSVVHALSDPGASGSSYGSAQTLDSPTQKMIASRREALSMLLKRVFTLLGAKNVVVKWPRVEDEATYRLIQAIATMWETGLFHPEELRGKFGDLVDLAISGTAPSDVLIPNTKGSLKAAQDVKPEPQATGFATNAQGRDGLGIGKTDDQAGDRPIRDDER